MIAVLASGQRWGTALASGNRFAAAVSFYPGCFTIQPATGRPYEIVNPDIDRPLLVLMGERDNETPPGECVPKLEAAKAAGAPVEWHVYPEATHCWDCKNLDGSSKVNFRGSQVVYRYDRGITDDSSRRMFSSLRGPSLHDDDTRVSNTTMNPTATSLRSAAAGDPARSADKECFACQDLWLRSIADNGAGGATP